VEPGGIGAGARPGSMKLLQRLQMHREIRRDLDPPTVIDLIQTLH
jgi:hypothetical protein